MKATKTKVIKTLKGVVLVNPDGKPVLWTPDANHAIGSYAIRHSRIILKHAYPVETHKS